MLWLYWIVLSALSAVIAYQDFRKRLITLWLILGFGIANISQFLVRYSVQTLLENLLFCFLYFLFSFLVIHLFYFIKTRKFQKVLNDKIGWGDIWLFVLIGSCLDPVELIYFFTAAFITAIGIQVIFIKREKSIPLGGVLVICYSLYLAYSISQSI